MGGFTFKPGGRVKLDVIRDFKPIGIRGFVRHAHDSRRRQRRHQLQPPRQGDAAEPRHPRHGGGQRAADVHRDRLLRQQQRAAPAPRLRLVGRPAGRSDLDARSWTKTTCRARSTSNRRPPSRRFGRRRCAGRRRSRRGSPGRRPSRTTSRRSSFPTEFRARPNTRCPIWSTRFRFDMRRGHITTSGFLGARQRSVRPKGDAGHGRRCGARWLSAKFNAGRSATRIYGVFTSARASAATAAARPRSPTTPATLHAVGGVAFMGGYEHFWAERWSTNGVYSVADTDDEDFYTSAINKRLTYGAVNLLYWFLGSRVDGRRVSLRPPRSVRRRAVRHGAPGAVCGPLQPAVSDGMLFRRAHARVALVALLLASVAALTTTSIAQGSRPPDPKSAASGFVWHDLVTDNPAAAARSMARCSAGPSKRAKASIPATPSSGTKDSRWAGSCC